MKIYKESIGYSLLGRFLGILLLSGLIILGYYYLFVGKAFVYGYFGIVVAVLFTIIAIFLNVVILFSLRQILTEFHIDVDKDEVQIKYFARKLIQLNHNDIKKIVIYKSPKSHRETVMGLNRVAKEWFGAWIILNEGKKCFSVTFTVNDEGNVVMSELKNFSKKYKLEAN